MTPWPDCHSTFSTMCIVDRRGKTCLPRQEISLASCWSVMPLSDSLPPKRLSISGSHLHQPVSCVERWAVIKTLQSVSRQDPAINLLGQVDRIGRLILWGQNTDELIQMKSRRFIVTQSFRLSFRLYLEHRGGSGQNCHRDIGILKAHRVPRSDSLYSVIRHTSSWNKSATKIYIHIYIMHKFWVAMASSMLSIVGVSLLHEYGAKIIILMCFTIVIKPTCLQFNSF